MSHERADVAADSQHSTDPEQPRKVAATGLRLIVCGDKFAGKTTLSSRLVRACSKRKYFGDKVRSKTSKQPGFDGSVDGHTRGIKVHKLQPKGEHKGIHISLWDMAGQREFGALHDCMFNRDSSSEDCTCLAPLVLFVWSPVTSNREGQKVGGVKRPKDFHESLLYWLKLIVACNTDRQSSNVVCKVIVAITCKDRMPFAVSYVAVQLASLKEAFTGIVDLEWDEKLQVDARDSLSVEPLVSYIFEVAKSVLQGVEIYDVCHEVSTHLSSSFSRWNKFSRNQPPGVIITWEDFEKYMEKEFNIKSGDVQKAIASSLHFSGDLIHLGNMVVLDVRWFCQDMVVMLIYFSELLDSDITPVIKGFAATTYVENLLAYHAMKKVPGSQLVSIMEALHLCFKNPNIKDQLFIPSTLSTQSSRGIMGSALEWTESIDEGPFAYLGRRLECTDPGGLTCFNRGFFDTLQLHLCSILFGGDGDDKVEIGLKMGNFMSICTRSHMEIILECGHNSREEHTIIDVMGRVSSALDEKEKKILIHSVGTELIQAIKEVYKDCIANQGANLLVESVIHPDCLVGPVPLEERENKCITTHALKQQLRNQLEERTIKQPLVYGWDQNRTFEELLGVEVVKEIIKAYKEALISAEEEVINHANELVCKQDDDKAEESTPSGKEETSTGIALEKGTCSNNPQNMSDEKSFARAMNTLVSFKNYLKRDMDDIKSSLHTLQDAVLDEVVQIQNRVLPKVVDLLKQSLHFAIDKEAAKLPRLVSLTTDGKTKGKWRLLTNSLLKGQLESVHIELFCEHRECPHKVEKQEGLSLTVVKDGSLLNQALPWINGLVKLLSLVVQVAIGSVLQWGSGLGLNPGLSSGPGSGIDAIPDLASLIALDTPGLLDNKGVRIITASSSKEALEGWQQWLQSVLRSHGGTSEENIFKHFNLKRVIYPDTSHVAWVCPMHFSWPAEGRRRSVWSPRPYPLLDPSG